MAGDAPSCIQQGPRQPLRSPRRTCGRAGSEGIQFHGVATTVGRRERVIDNRSVVKLVALGLVPGVRGTTKDAVAISQEAFVLSLPNREAAELY